MTNAAYGAILLNGAAWLFVPAARRLKLAVENVRVRRANRRRREMAAALQAADAPSLLGGGAADGALARRLQAAREMRARGRAHEAAAGAEQALYTTAQSLLEQAERHSPVAEAWDAELRRRSSRSSWPR